MTIKRRAPAWAYLLMNTLVLPGAGTYMGGRRLAGCVQAILALAGFVLTTLWIWAWFSVLIRTGEPPEGLGPRAAEGLGGMALFLISWLWALASGLALLKQARERQGAERPPSS